MNATIRLLLLLARSAFRDDFNRADQNLESNPNWTTDFADPNAAAIRSNQLAAASSGHGNGSAYWSPDLRSANHFIQVELRSYVTAPGIFACCRLATRDNFVGVLANSGTGGLEVWKRVAGTFTALVQLTSGATIGDIVRLETIGDNYRLLRNGILLSSGAIGAASLNSTRQGFVADFGVQNPAFDNYTAGAL